MELTSPRFFDDFAGPDSLSDASQHDERRQHTRNVRVMRVARLKDIRVHAECLGMVRDVSPGGMMIDALFPLEIGQSISIALLDDQDLTGEIVWKDGKTVGVKFLQEIPVDQILAKPAMKVDGQRARLPRFSICKASQIKVDSRMFDAVLIDISQRGAKLSCDVKLRLNSNILIRLNASHSVCATVKWTSDGLLGVEFHRLLPVTELAGWLATD